MDLRIYNNKHEKMFFDATFTFDYHLPLILIIKYYINIIKIKGYNKIIIFQCMNRK